MKTITTIVRSFRTSGTSSSSSTSMTRILLVGLMLLTLVCSCSTEDADDLGAANPAGVPIGGVKGYASYFDENLLQTRAGDALKKKGYEDYEGGDKTIAFALTQNGQTPKKGHLFKVEDEWRTNIGAIAAGDYYLYGFIPNLSVIKFNITDRDGVNANYSVGAKMVLEDVPTVVDNDLCVVVGAKQGYDKDHDGSSSEFTDVNGNGEYDEGIDTRLDTLRLGDFKYKASAITGSGGTDNYIFLLLDHLYAAIRINMKVYADYAALRTIKLKSLQLATKAGGDVSKDKTNITIDLARTSGSDVKESPIQSITFTPAGVPINLAEGGMEFWSSASGHELTTDFQSFIGHFMPNGITTLILTSTYDVYDRKGNKIRENCQATNTMVLKDLLTEQETTQRGKRYTINMTILPTYLYVLSDPDLNNPTVKIVD